MKNWIYGFLVVVLLVASIGWKDWRHRSEQIAFVITDSGDTAQVAFIAPAFAIDSFLYHDSIRYPADTSLFDTCSFVSPLTYYELTPVLDTHGTYICSLKYAADTVGFTWVCPEDATIDTVVERLYDSLTGIAGIADSIAIDTNAAHTVLTLTAKYSQETFADHRPMVLATATGGTAAIGKDSTITTVAMVVDSLVAAINALDSAHYWTAANSGDTAYTVTSDQKGLFFFIDVTDTTQDTSTIQANVTSKSIFVDTILLEDIPSFNGKRWGGLYGRFRIDSTLTTDTMGIGLSDSIYIQLWTKYRLGGTDVFDVIARDSSAALPGSLWVKRLDAAGTDSTIKGPLYLYIYLTDTASLINTTVYCPLHMDYDLYEDK